MVSWMRKKWLQQEQQKFNMQNITWFTQDLYMMNNLDTIVSLKKTINHQIVKSK